MAALTIQLPPLESAKPLPIFGDREYQEIRNQVKALRMFEGDPDFDKVFNVLQSWELICEAFRKHAQILEPLNSKIVAWNPNNDQTQKVKETWVKIYGPCKNTETDYRESVLANLFILNALFRTHDQQEAYEHNMHLQTEIRTKIDEFFPKGITHEQAMRYVLENEQTFTQFKNMSNMWLPKEPRNFLLNYRVASLLAILDPETEKKRAAFQEKFQEFHFLRLSESDMRADSDTDIQKGINLFFPEGTTYEQSERPCFKGSTSVYCIRR